MAYPGVGGVLLHGHGVSGSYEKKLLSYSLESEAKYYYVIVKDIDCSYGLF